MVGILDKMVERYVGAPYFPPKGVERQECAYQTHLDINGFNVPCKVEEVRVYQEEPESDHGARLVMEIVTTSDGLILELRAKAMETLSERTVETREPTRGEWSIISARMDRRSFEQIDFGEPCALYGLHKENLTSVARKYFALADRRVRGATTRRRDELKKWHYVIGREVVKWEQITDWSEMFEHLATNFRFITGTSDYHFTFPKKRGALLADMCKKLGVLRK